MTSDSMDWDEEIPDDPEEEYLALVRALKRKKGFGLFFVRCSQKEGKQIIERVKQDIPQKTIEVLRFIEPIDNLYNRVANLANRDHIDILFIQGIEYSLYEYELKTFGEITELYFNNFTSVPRILSHLNQQRERFRDDFDICFVFLLCPFALKYFIQRAPDFFDWKSGVFEFPIKPEDLKREASRILQEGAKDKYIKLTHKQRIKTIIEIQDLLEEDNQISGYTTSLLLELQMLLIAEKDYEGAIASIDQALKFKPDDSAIWAIRAYLLDELGRYEEAIASFNQALKLKPDNSEAWNHRGVTLFNLGRYQDALASYNLALRFQADDAEAWYNRGVTLFDLGRLEEAIASYEQALQCQTEFPEAWYNRGVALRNLGKLEEAIASYDQALQFHVNFPEAWYNRGNALRKLGRLEEAIASYEQVLKINPKDCESCYNKACNYALQGNVEEAIENLQQAINLNPDEYREMAKTDSNFDSIRDDERFQALIEEPLPHIKDGRDAHPTI